MKRKAEEWAGDLPEEATPELRPEGSIRRVPRRAGESGSKCPTGTAKAWRRRRGEAAVRGRRDEGRRASDRR